MRSFGSAIKLGIRLMKKTEEKKLTATEKLATKTNTWIEKNAKFIAIGAGVVVVLLIALAVVFSQLDKKAEAKFAAIEEVASLYNNLFTLDPESDEYKAAVDEFKTAANDVLASSGLNEYPGAKAALLLGDYAFVEDNDYATALEYYNDVEEAQSKTYLSQLAAINAAACNENLGNIDAALDAYINLWDTYGADGLYGSRALFNTARLYEAKGQMDLALATYEQLVGEYQDVSSEYAKLAKSRIAQLN